VRISSATNDYIMQAALKQFDADVKFAGGTNVDSKAGGVPD